MKNDRCVMPSVESICAEKDEIVVSVIHAGSTAGVVYYHLTPDLDLRRVGISSSYEYLHRQLQDSRALDHSIDAREVQRLSSIIRR